MSEEPLIIVGASTRAAAFSALRAGLKPWCIDLFADADLRAKCPVMQIPREKYPHGLAELIRQHAPPGPWMYTGGLENHWDLVQQVSEERSLWGTNATALAAVRDPNQFGRLTHHFARVETDAQRVPGDGTWLIKPALGCGGKGIRAWRGNDNRCRGSNSYFQEFVVGEPHSTLYVAAQEGVRILGVTRQLVGESWLHAPEFAYCGSLGPVAGSVSEQAKFSTLGVVCHRDFRLRGLFGIDFVVDEDGRPWATEVNPRYTASVEVLELAMERASLACYPQIFGGAESTGLFHRNPPILSRSRKPLVGKAILYAKNSLIFPADGPWSHLLRDPLGVREMPPYADIPIGGTPIAAGQPILTFFARSASKTECLEELKRIAAELDRWLYKG